MALIGKIIPQQIDATIRRELPEMTREELFALLDHLPRPPMKLIESSDGGEGISAARPVFLRLRMAKLDATHQSTH